MSHLIDTGVLRHNVRSRIFKIGDERLPRAAIWALGTIKQAVAQVNADLGLLETELAESDSQGGTRGY